MPASFSDCDRKNEYGLYKLPVSVGHKMKLPHMHFSPAPQPSTANLGERNWNWKLVRNRSLSTLTTQPAIDVTWSSNILLFRCPIRLCVNWTSIRQKLFKLTQNTRKLKHANKKNNILRVDTSSPWYPRIFSDNSPAGMCSDSAETHLEWLVWSMRMEARCGSERHEVWSRSFIRACIVSFSDAGWAVLYYCHFLYFL